MNIISDMLNFNVKQCFTLVPLRFCGHSAKCMLAVSFNLFNLPKDETTRMGIIYQHMQIANNIYINAINKTILHMNLPLFDFISRNTWWLYCLRGIYLNVYFNCTMYIRLKSKDW